jgi:hypothetical protein
MGEGFRRPEGNVTFKSGGLKKPALVRIRVVEAFHEQKILFFLSGPRIRAALDTK